jgi:tetratricopeptide (TPR) repeat protein
MAGDDWVVESLRAAAKTAVASGALESGVAYLRRALAEPPSESLRPRVLLELGFAEYYAGEQQAGVHLREALETATDATARASITIALGLFLQIDGRNREALDVFDRTRARLGNTNRRAALTLESAALGVAQLEAETADRAAEGIARLRRLAEEEPDLPQSVCGMLAVAATMANEPAETVARLALRALAGAPKLFPEAVDRPPFFFYYHACSSLTLAERYEEALSRYEEALSRYDEALADSRRLGVLRHVLALSCYRALVHLRVGDLADAEADARVALETGPILPGHHAALALAVLLETLAERGEFEAAEAADQRYRLAERFPTIVHGGWVLAARGRLRLAELRPAAALHDLLAAGDLFARLRCPSPVIPWRSDAALAQLALGAQAEARALAAEEVALAEAFGAPRTLGDSAARGRPRRGRKARHRAAAPGGTGAGDLRRATRARARDGPLDVVAANPRRPQPPSVSPAS